MEGLQRFVRLVVAQRRRTRSRHGETVTEIPPSPHQQMNYSIYVLFSILYGRAYIGQSDDAATRLPAHNGEVKPTLNLRLPSVMWNHMKEHQQT